MKSGFVQEGLVSTIERFSIHDGPGIRTVVFLKGCPLTCIWCSSPHTQKPSPEIAYYEERCIYCGSCRQACPESAIGTGQNDAIDIDRGKCTNCGECTDYCYAQALKILGKRMSVREVLLEVERDRAFYEKSGGGVTVSGGEPLMQPAFTVAILRGCQEMGIQTAIETSGFASSRVFREVLMCTDLVFCDIKHMEEKEHIRLTGQSNRPILRNISILDRSGKPYVLRFPLIPTVNDSRENLVSMCEWAVKLRNLKAIEIVPYHRLGVAHYQALRKTYDLMHVNVPRQEYIAEIKDTLRAFSLSVWEE